MARSRRIFRSAILLVHTFILVTCDSSLNNRHYDEGILVVGATNRHHLLRGVKNNNKDGDDNVEPPAASWSTRRLRTHSNRLLEGTALDNAKIDDSYDEDDEVVEEDEYGCTCEESSGLPRSIEKMIRKQIKRMKKAKQANKNQTWRALAQRSGAEKDREEKVVQEELMNELSRNERDLEKKMNKNHHHQKKGIKHGSKNVNEDSKSGKKSKSGKEATKQPSNKPSFSPSMSYQSLEPSSISTNKPSTTKSKSKIGKHEPTKSGKKSKVGKSKSGKSCVCPPPPTMVPSSHSPTINEHTKSPISEEPTSFPSTLSP